MRVNRSLNNPVRIEPFIYYRIPHYVISCRLSHLAHLCLELMTMKMCHEETHDIYRNCKSSLTTLGIGARYNILSQPINVIIESECITACAHISSDGKRQSCKY